MIVIKHPPIEKRPKNREIKMSANCAEVLKFLMICADNSETYWVNRPFIAECLNMPLRDVYASLVGLQSIGLVERHDEHKIYRYIPQNEEIKFKEEMF